MATGAGFASAGIGLFQVGSSIVDKIESEEAIDKFKQQKLINPAENIPISTLKSEQETEAGLSRFATAVDTLQRGGTRAVAGGLPRLNESNILLQQKISQDLEDQDRQRNLLIAQGEQRIQEMREQRELMALQGLGNKYQTARQDIASGFGNIVSSTLALTSGFDGENKSGFSKRGDKLFQGIEFQDAFTVERIIS